MLAILGNIAGDRAILLGCEAAGASRNPGYVFLRTADCPEGEVVYFEGGPTTGGMYLKKEAVPINAYGVDYPQTYTARSLAPGIGAEQYDWVDFAVVTTNRALAVQLAQMAIDLASVGVTPFGVPMPYCGTEAPIGYALCDGRTLKIADCPALHAVIGGAFNTAPDANGNAYAAPAAGYFRLPDMRGRFVVGYNAADADYNVLGRAGGKKRHQLTAAELPAHTHPAPTGKFVTTTGGTTPGGAGEGSRNCLQAGTVTMSTDTGANTGGGASHENRPPYYTLNYIIRIK
jgi:microcystin-dependent protein